MPSTFLLILLALLSAAVPPLVLAALLMAMLSARLRRPARQVLVLALPGALLAGGLSRLAGLRTIGLLGPMDGPFFVAGAVFSAWVFVHIGYLLWQARRGRHDGPQTPPDPRSAPDPRGVNIHLVMNFPAPLVENPGPDPQEIRPGRSA